MATTPIYGLPYQGLTDPPHGPNLGKNLAEKVETELQRMDTSPNVQVFTSSGTWTKPAGAKFVWVRGVGGGGAGGGAAGGGAGTSACGASGGSGGYCESIYAAGDLASSVSVTIGAGGTGNSAATGGNGGSTSFGAHFAAGGGGGGSAGASSASSTTAGAGSGGSATGGNVLNRQGDFGGLGRTIGADQTFAQKGASSPFGAGGNTSLSTGGNGSAATGYGAGGGNAIASTASRAGGAGTGGFVVAVTYF